MLHGDARLRKNAGERKLARTSDKRQATSDKRQATSDKRQATSAARDASQATSIAARCRAKNEITEHQVTERGNTT
ncbi:50S ribosomal protein L19 [Burkholderia thailandensis]|nr:50S ribosomal protein L19 [Burkholderia thailandensis]